MNKQEAWKYYKTWMKERTYCKALKTEVHITRKGWDHIAKGTHSKPRKVKDRINRFQLLKLAKLLIKTAEEFVIVDKHNNRYYLLEFKSRKSIIKVLLKKDSEGKFYFYSVMKH
jgi:hypothetical protein